MTFWTAMPSPVTALLALSGAMRPHRSSVLRTPGKSLQSAVQCGSTCSIVRGRFGNQRDPQRMHEGDLAGLGKIRGMKDRLDAGCAHGVPSPAFGNCATIAA